MITTLTFPILWHSLLLSHVDGPNASVLRRLLLQRVCRELPHRQGRIHHSSRLCRVSPPSPSHPQDGCVAVRKELDGLRDERGQVQAEGEGARAPLRCSPPTRIGPLPAHERRHQSRARRDPDPHHCAGPRCVSFPPLITSQLHPHNIALLLRPLLGVLQR